MLSLLFLMTGTILLAQSAIKGKVIDRVTNSPLSGATISAGGKNIATTDKDGSFSISCTNAGIISLSFVGYEMQKIKVACNDKVTISLKPADDALDNVEITATSNQNKALLYQPVSITKLSLVELKEEMDYFLMMRSTQMCRA